jgi:hypothetical protein
VGIVNRIQNAWTREQQFNPGTLVLVPGPLRPVPKDGLFEYDGTDLWFTRGIVREKVVFLP